jgi:hypothetical protein
MTRSAVASCLVILACGGDTTPPARDAGKDVQGWTQCASPTGQQVCGGPNQCPFGDGKECACIPTVTTNVLSVCATSPGLTAESCQLANDGRVCVEVGGVQPSPGWGPGTGELELGLLFLKNGASDRVRYADFGLFDGTALPEPSTCPTLQSAQMCGGNCGSCAQNEICHGRSPLHPYGFCVPHETELKNTCRPANPCGSTADGCFLFKVQAEAQAVADNYGLCVPKAMCKELASQTYPGGGTCLAQ